MSVNLSLKEKSMSGTQSDIPSVLIQLIGSLKNKNSRQLYYYTYYTRLYSQHNVKFLLNPDINISIRIQ